MELHKVVALQGEINIQKFDDRSARKHGNARAFINGLAVTLQPASQLIIDSQHIRLAQEALTHIEQHLATKRSYTFFSRIPFTQAHTLKKTIKQNREILVQKIAQVELRIADERAQKIAAIEANKENYQKFFAIKDEIADQIEALINNQSENRDNINDSLFFKNMVKKHTNDEYEPYLLYFAFKGEQANQLSVCSSEVKEALENQNIYLIAFNYDPIFKAMKLVNEKATSKVNQHFGTFHHISYSWCIYDFFQHCLKVD